MKVCLLSVRVLALFADDASSFKQAFAAAWSSAPKDNQRGLRLLDEQAATIPAGRPRLGWAG